jgi:hypothetical protein
MAQGMRWSQRDKMLLAGEAVQGWETLAQANGAHISQVNFVIDPAQEGDSPTAVIFEWDDATGEYLMRTS